MAGRIVPREGVRVRRVLRMTRGPRQTERDLTDASARFRVRRAKTFLAVGGALALLFAMPALADSPTFGGTPDITVEATASSGAFVDLSGVSATDDNGTPDIVCSPSTGTFSLGTTPVSCTATDTV